MTHHYTVGHTHEYMAKVAEHYRVSQVKVFAQVCFDGHKAAVVDSYHGGTGVRVVVNYSPLVLATFSNPIMLILSAISPRITMATASDKGTLRTFKSASVSSSSLSPCVNPSAR